MTNKYLLVGSAPYIADWWASHGDWFRAHRWKVCPVNNAWAVVKWGHCWYRSSDFWLYAALQPSPAEERLFTHRKCPRPATGEIRTDMWWCYKKPEHGVVMLSSLYNLMNEEWPDEIAVIGSDFYYGDKRTHFYGRGKTHDECAAMIAENAPELTGKAADPLRYGEEWLRGELEHAIDQAAKAGVRLWNASSGPTLLPFERFEGHLGGCDEDSHTD